MFPSTFLSKMELHLLWKCILYTLNNMVFDAKQNVLKLQGWFNFKRKYYLSSWCLRATLSQPSGGSRARNLLMWGEVASVCVLVGLGVEDGMAASWLCGGEVGGEREGDVWSELAADTADPLAGVWVSTLLVNLRYSAMGALRPSRATSLHWKEVLLVSWKNAVHINESYLIIIQKQVMTLL